MSLQILEQISQKRERTVNVNRLAMEKRIPLIQQIYGEITGMSRSEKFFERQAGMTDDSKDRNNDYRRFIDTFLSVSFADKRRGDLFVADFNSIVDWRNDQDFRLKRDFITVKCEVDALTNGITYAYLDGRFDQVKASIIKLRVLLSEMQDCLTGEFIKNEYFSMR